MKFTDPMPQQHDMPNDDAGAEDIPANAFEAAWPFNADSSQVAGVVSDARFLSIMLVDVTGLEWNAIAEHLPMIRDVARTRTMVPVLVVDLVDFRGLIAENLAYDTLPNVGLNGTLDVALDWDGYLMWRRHLLREKWRPAAIINLGLGADWDTP